jgi:sulfonate transport system substrate-binding protein
MRTTFVSRLELGALPVRRSLALLATVAASAALAACSSSGPTAQSSPGSGPPSIPASVPAGVTLRVADQVSGLKELLAAAGQNTRFPYQVDYSELTGGTAMLQAFQAGSVDLALTASTPLIFAQAAHLAVQGVAAWAPENGSAALVSAPDAVISGWAGLKGKKVAYQKGTVEEAALLEGLASAGLSLKDITPVNLPTTSIVPALESRSVTAAILLQPFTAAYLEQNPAAHQVLAVKDITTRVAFLAATATALSNPGTAAAIADYIGRVEKAEEWVNTHQRQWAQIQYVQQYKMPPALAAKVLAEQGPYSFLPLPGDVAGPQQSLANLYASVGEIPARLSVSAEFDSRFNPVVQENQ